MTKTKRLLKAVLIAGTLEGVLVAVGTTTNLLLSGSKNPLRLLNFLSSGIFGEAAFKGGHSMIYIGLLLHFIISVTWVFLLFSFDPVLKLYSKKWLVNGVLYGVFIWFVMALIVMPLSNAPPVPITVKGAFIDATGLVLCAGLPISYLAKRHFLKRTNSNTTTNFE